MNDGWGVGQDEVAMLIGYKEIELFALRKQVAGLTMALQQVAPKPPVEKEKPAEAFEDTALGDENGTSGAADE